MYPYRRPRRRHDPDRRARAPDPRDQARHPLGDVRQSDRRRPRRHDEPCYDLHHRGRSILLWTGRHLEDHNLLFDPILPRDPVDDVDVDATSGGGRPAPKARVWTWSSGFSRQRPRCRSNDDVLLAC